MNVAKHKSMTWAIGIPALASACLMHGCGYIGTPKDPDVQVIPEDAAWPVNMDSAVAVQPIPPSGPVTTPYSIVKGDTLMVIAAQYDLRWQDIVAVNPGITPNRLRIGQIIQLPGQVDLTFKKAVNRAPAKPAVPAASRETGATVTHKVQKGESLSVLAHRYGVKIADIRKANHLTSDVIRIGQTLKIVNPTRVSGAGASSTPAAVKAPAIVAPVNAATPAAAVTPVNPAPPKPAPTLEAANDAAAAVAAPAAAAPQSFRLYTVKENEDLYAVAIRWGVSPNEIKTLNNLTENELEPGRTIKIPNPQEPQP